MTKSRKTKSSPEASPPKRSKKDQLIELLRRKSGASIEEMTTATGWLPHTVRATLTGLRKQGLQVGKAKTEGVTRYSIRREAGA